MNEKQSRAMAKKLCRVEDLIDENLSVLRFSDGKAAQALEAAKLRVTEARFRMEDPL